MPQSREGRVRCQGAGAGGGGNVRPACFCASSVVCGKVGRCTGHDSYAGKARMLNRPVASGKQAKGFRESVLVPFVASVSRLSRLCTRHVRTVYALHPISVRSRFGGRLGLICRQIMSYLAAKQPCNGGKSLPCTESELLCTEWPGTRSQGEKMLSPTANRLSLVQFRFSQVTEEPFLRFTPNLFRPNCVYIYEGHGVPLTE